MTITNKTINIILGSAIVGLLIMWRCERQNAIEYSEKVTQKELENEILWSEIDLLKKRNIEANEKIKTLEFKRDSINLVIEYMSNPELKEFWADYKRHYMPK